ncbi:urease accessory protein UreD [Sphingobium sp. CR28]|uniref:urease accessory protein UreD n=1 Tax=Sphingobium sp. CR28 TaxID=3400272 RepID=UPI003FEEAD1D
MIAFSKREIRDMAEVAPARLLFPEGKKSDFPLVFVTSTSGGLAGGDRMTLAISIAPGASGTVVPQTAEKIHGSRPEEPPTTIKTRISIGEGGRCEWVAHEAILFDRGRMRRSLDIDLTADARVLAMETLELSRDTQDEACTNGSIYDSWTIQRDGRLIWSDTLRFEGEIPQLEEPPSNDAPAPASATLVYAGPDARDHLALARTLMAPAGGKVIDFDGLLVMRLSSGDPQTLRRDLMRAGGVLRAAIFGVSPSMAAIGYR